MMATLGFGSQFSIVECVLSALTDEFSEWLSPRKNNIIFRISFCFLMFLLGLPMVSQVCWVTIFWRIAVTNYLILHTLCSSHSF